MPGALVRPEAASLTKLIDLFSSPLAAGVQQRHAAGLQRLLETNQAGFKIADLTRVQQLLLLTKELVLRGDEELCSLLLQMLGVLAKPFISLTSTDEFKLEASIVSVLTTVGELCCCLDVPVQVAACAAQMLGAFADAPGPCHLVDGSLVDIPADAQRRQRNARLLGESGAATSVVAALQQRTRSTPSHATASAHQSCIAVLVDTVSKLSSMPSVCASLASAGVFKPVTDLLLACDLHHELTPSLVELVWNLIEHEPQCRDLACGYTIELEDDTINISRAMDPLGSPAAMRPAADQPQAADSNPVAEDALAAASAHQSEDGAAGSLGQSSLDLAGSLQQAPAVEEGGPGDLSPAPGPMDRSMSIFMADTSALAAAEENVEQAMAAGLTNLTRQALEDGSRRVDRELRNDVLVVTMLLAQVPSFVVVLRDSGMLDLLLPAICEPRNPRSPSPTRSLGSSQRSAGVPGTSNPEEFEFQQLACGLIVRMCEDPVSLEQALEAGFLRLLLATVDVEQQGSAPHQRWSPPQQHSLQEAALLHLHALVPLCPQEYSNCEGPGVLLQFIGHVKHPALVEAALRHLQHACSAAPQLAEPLGECGAVGTALELMSNPNLPESARHWAVMLTTALCTGQEENQRRFRKADGVVVLQMELGRLRDADAFSPSPLAIAIVDLVAAAVLPARKTMARFLVADGLGALLDVLEACHAALHPLIVTVIADMLQNPRTHPFFLDWRSSVTELNAVHLLVKLWQQAQDQLAKDRAASATAGSRTTSALSMRLSTQSKSAPAALAKVVPAEQMLLKIHACLSLLDFAELGNTVSPADEAVLHEIELHLRFEQGRVWTNIAATFQAEGMVPTEADQQRLDAALQLSRQLDRQLADSRAEALSGIARSQAEAEATFYRDKTLQRQREAEAKNYKKDRSNLTTKERQEAKAKKEEMLRNSFRNISAEAGTGD